MSQSLLYRIFGFGKTLPEITESLAGEEVIFEVEGIGVTRHRHGRVEGERTGGSVDLHYGGLIVTQRRLVCFAAAGEFVDAKWDATGRVARAIFTPEGLTVTWDLHAANPAWEGEMSLHYKQPLTVEQIATFPKPALSFDVDPVLVRTYFMRIHGNELVR